MYIPCLIQTEYDSLHPRLPKWLQHFEVHAWGFQPEKAKNITIKTNKNSIIYCRNGKSRLGTVVGTFNFYLIIII